jgi:hypothetical protein
LEGRAKPGKEKVRVELFIIFSMSDLISPRSLRGSEVACPYERDKEFQGNGTIAGFDEAPNSSGGNGKFAIVM